MLDLEAPGSLKLLSEAIHKDVNTWCVDKYDDGPRSHLGASVIGKPCSRHLWYMFRWIAHKKFDGRMYRLFQRGHREEVWITEFLEGIGCEVQLFDKVLFHHPESDSYFYESPDKVDHSQADDVEGILKHEEEAKRLGIFLDKGKRQMRISAHSGHFGGSCDGTLKLPERYGIQQKVIFLKEDKTQSCKKFSKLQIDGVQLNKHEHFCQMCTYGIKLGLEYGVYTSVNKNDDELHIEVVKLDPFLGQEMIDKGGRIIYAEVPPAKIAMSPKHFDCNWCDTKDVCWNYKSADMNCRSCKQCSPVDNAQWECAKYGIVPKEAIINGCGEWESII